MRARLIFLAAGVAATLAACSTTPRDPAPIVRGSASACSDTVTVVQGDTLYTIASRCGLSISQLAAANDLTRPFRLTPGQRLRMPGPSTYRVRRGDNLYRIGLAHGMSTDDIARLNGLRPPYEIHPGQELRVRGPVRSVAEAPQQPISEPNDGGWTPPPGPSPTPQPPAPNPMPAAQANFAWPLNGPVIGRFGEQQGQRLNGIRIQAQVGEPVRASASGEVVYAGNELQGYGELILIRHQDRWVTAYGLNTEILVQEGQQVTAGQHIANAGGAGGEETPALHFEIRRGVTPVNPEQQLPRR